ncbi:GNAT family N-acetyltransferase [Actinoplanes sp. CA-030573]|uniref:GNAT family N-acetyltransferase n=1 Tax=Actinoplanes sp. CA-030573 TaxID=3239898 RepID=UPI003D8B9158
MLQRPPTLTMRPATADDEKPLAELIHARSDWLQARGLADWHAAADELAAQAADPEIPTWVLTANVVEVIGCTTLYEESPASLWTAQERAEPAIFMATTVIDPAYAGQRIGCHLAWWVLDYAARAGRTAVRRGTIEPGLVRYYRDAQGWTVVRAIHRGGVTVTGLSRPATRMPDLRVTSTY